MLPILYFIHTFNTFLPEKYRVGMACRSVANRGTTVLLLLLSVFFFLGGHSYGVSAAGLPGRACAGSDGG